MIIERLIDDQLKSHIQISSQDIVDFYRKHREFNPGTSKKNPGELNIIENEKRLVSRLRAQKTQKAYKQWIQDIWKNYSIKINEKKLKAFLIDMGAHQESKK
jgi:hypothetical protein